ncbi:MAG TPA: phosphonate utilization associated transcriptional regulator [Burkholderiales bacterium]|nr:phosphonate utilization associated transcriptional regulator [Burkholderiales bacterium]
MNPPSSTIELIQSHSLTMLVRRELERRILSGEVSPGDKLNEAEIATQLNVSRSPVREALRALEQTGLVQIEKNRGVSVRELSLQDADEIYEFRAHLDEVIGQLAARRVTTQQVAQLRELLRKMQEAARTRNVARYYPLNLRFHDLLAEIAGNRALLGAYRRLVNELHLYRRETLAHGPDSFPISAREHAEIVERIAQRDSEGAGRLLREHAKRSRERLHLTFETPAPAGKAQRRRASTRAS